MASRKQIAAALLALLGAGGQFPRFGRRLLARESAASPGQPALFLVKPSEDYEREESGTPGVRIMDFLAVIYTDVSNDPTGVPADIIDDLLDAIDVQLRPTGNDLVTHGRQTLGGLVYDCRIVGKPEIAPGDVTGKGETVVPIQVTLP